MNSFEATLNISKAHLKCALGHVELSRKFLEAWKEKNPDQNDVYDEAYHRLESIELELKLLSSPRREPRW